MIIGLCGAARSGKDTVASMLPFNTYAFAEPMKEACRVIFGWNDEHLHGELKDVVDPIFNTSPRHALQTLGTQWGRELVNSNIWLIAAQNKINQSENLILTDVRFDNEADLILSNGGIIIRVNRKGLVGVLDHVSESGISSSKITFELDNNGSLNDLRQLVKNLNL
jgi:hypothetical protein